MNAACMRPARAVDRTRRLAGGFSLVEILAVMMLLTVLMMVAFPAFRSLQRTQQRQRAAYTAGALAEAAMSYRRVYGMWPAETNRPFVNPLAHENSEYVAGKNIGEQLALSNVVALLRGMNPRRTAFLEVNDNELAADGTLVDPWGQPYVLVMERATGSVRAEGGVVQHGIRRDGLAVSVDATVPAAAFSWGDPSDRRGGAERVVASWPR